MFDLEKAKAEIIARHNAQFPEEQSPKESTGDGPKTEAGKQGRRFNAYKHGLTGQIQIFTPEEHEAYDAHCKSTVAALAPIGTLEQQLAQSIAEDKWRINRAHAIESGIFVLGQLQDLADPDPLQPDPLQIDKPQMDHALSQARTWLGNGKNIQLLSLYEQRIQRSIERSMAELRTLRAERLAARQQAVEEAILLTQLAKSKGEAYHPPADYPTEYFVFSRAEMEPLIARKQCLDEARNVR